MKQFIEDKKFKKQSSSPLFDNDYILVSDLKAFMEGKVVVDVSFLKEMERIMHKQCLYAVRDRIEAMLSTQEGE